MGNGQHGMLSSSKQGTHTIQMGKEASSLNSDGLRIAGLYGDGCLAWLFIIVSRMHKLKAWRKWPRFYPQQRPEFNPTFDDCLTQTSGQFLNFSESICSFGNMGLEHMKFCWGMWSPRRYSSGSSLALGGSLICISFFWLQQRCDFLGRISILYILFSTLDLETWMTFIQANSLMIKEPFVRDGPVRACVPGQEHYNCTLLSSALRVAHSWTSVGCCF